MDTREILMGTIGRSFNDGRAKSITFCVTEECNLRCSYCYMTGKNSFHRMSLEVAKQAVDYFLSQEPEDEAVIWEFIGGEPLLEIDLIDQISDYIKQQMYLRNHPWFKNYIFNIGTNGVLYNDPRVQNYIRKNAAHISIGITIDGTKEKHDLNRVFANGSGSYDAIIDNVKLWQTQFTGATTKVTFASDDLKYLKESIIHLWNLGLKIIPANVVFEDVWKEGDTEVFRQQLMELADYILDNELWYDHSVRFFDPHVGHPMGKFAKSQRFCGSGKMSAIDCNGKLYPCIRFLDFCMPDKPALSVGDIYDGVIPSRMKQFDALTIERINDDECNKCQIASGCFSCSGCNYENSPTNSIYNRTKFHCELQKVQVECNEYFWTEVAKRMHGVTPFERYRLRSYQSEGWQITGAQYLYFLLSDDSPAYCMYKPTTRGLTMSQDTLREGVKYAHAHHMIPVYLGNPYDQLEEVECYRTHVVIDFATNMTDPVSEVAVQIPVLTNTDDLTTFPERKYSSAILLVESKHITGLSVQLITLAHKVPRINIMKQDLTNWTPDDINTYSTELGAFQAYSNETNLAVSINVLSSLSSNHAQHCQAGRTNYTLAPDATFYACPAFYFNSLGGLGDLTSGLNVLEPSLYEVEKAIPCKDCTNSSCLRCVYANKAATSTLNIAADIQCEITQAEASLCN